MSKKCARNCSKYKFLGSHVCSVPEEELISKAELRLTDIAEYLAYDWIPLAKQLRLTPEDIEKIEKEYTYVVEQVCSRFSLLV